MSRDSCKTGRRTGLGAKGFACRLRLARGGNMVDAKKIFGIMGLGAKKGDNSRIYFLRRGDEEQAYTAIR